jgi:hypothetical protein
MTRQDRPAGANVHYLEHGVELIRRLTDEAYSTCPENPYPGGVGSQFRHCLDFYDCFLRDLDTGRIDYSRRERDPRVESDRRHAIARFEQTCERLAGLSPERMEAPIEVKAEDAAPGSAEWSPSSPSRELQFLISHTIHHYALISVMLKTQGYEVSREFPEFGIAPSTLSYWKEASV